MHLPFVVVVVVVEVAVAVAVAAASVFVVFVVSCHSFVVCLPFLAADFLIGHYQDPKENSVYNEN